MNYYSGYKEKNYFQEAYSTNEFELLTMVEVPEGWKRSTGI